MYLDTSSFTNKDRQKLIDWLTIASNTDSRISPECDEVIGRLKREIKFFEYRDKFDNEDREKLRQEPLVDVNLKEMLENIDKNIEYTKLTDKKNWNYALHTRNELFLLSKDSFYPAALEFMKEHPVDDESLAYGKDDDYGGKDIKVCLICILDMLIHFIHIKAKDLHHHEFYNDYIDEWYFGCDGDYDSKKSRELMNKEYFFPTEVFIIKVGDLYFYYSETHGQGTIFDAYLFKDEKQLEDFGKQYGVSLSEVKAKAYNFDEVQ